MTETTSRTTLWRNISALMHHKYKRESLAKLAHDSGLGGATMTRIKACNTSIGVDQVDKLAQALHVQAWQLLKPDLDVNQLSSEISPPQKTTAEADAENLAMVIAAIQKDKRKEAVLKATQVLIGYLVPTPAPATSALVHGVNEANTE